nr:transposase family protein [Geobacillus sp. CAMR5420]
MFSASLESIPPNQHYTNRFCEYLYELCEGSTIQEVSRKHRIPYKHWNAFITPSHRKKQKSVKQR